MSPLLSYDVFGTGYPVLILHGLFGAHDNWKSLARRFSESFCIVACDLRNHGQSFHADSMTYSEMAEDVAHLIQELGFDQVSIIGHSMGGKVAMQLASQYPALIHQLVVVDIAPKEYPRQHDAILTTCMDLDLSQIQSRSQALDCLDIPNMDLRQFLVKSLKRGEDGYEWQFNLKSIQTHYDQIAAAPSLTPFNGEVLFIRGCLSDYITDEDKALLQQYFPNYQLSDIQDAGHWVHAEKQDQVYDTIMGFLTAPDS